MRLSTVGRLDANTGDPSGIALRLDEIPGINPDTQLPIKIVFSTFNMLTPNYTLQVVEYGRVSGTDYFVTTGVDQAENDNVSIGVEKGNFVVAPSSNGVVLAAPTNTVEFTAGNGGAPPNVVLIGAEDPAVQMEWVADIYMPGDGPDGWVPVPTAGYTVTVYGIERYAGNDVMTTDAVGAGYVTITEIPEPTGCFWTDLLRCTEVCGGGDPTPEPFWYSLLPNFAAAQRWFRYPGEFGTALPYTSGSSTTDPGIAVRYWGGPEGAVTKIRYAFSAQTAGPVTGSPAIELSIDNTVIASTVLTSGAPVLLESSGDVDLSSPVSRSDSFYNRFPTVEFRVSGSGIPATTFDCTLLEIYVEPGEGIPGAWVGLDEATDSFVYLSLTTEPGVTWDGTASELYATDLPPSGGIGSSVFKVEYDTTTWLRFTPIAYEATSPGAGTTIEPSEIHVSANGDSGVFTQSNRASFPGTWTSSPIAEFIPSPALIPVEYDVSPHVDYFRSNAALETFRYKIEIWVET